MSFANALWFTALQERIPREALSRVSSYDWLGSLVFQPAGYALAGPAAAILGTSVTLLVSAAVQLSVCIGGAVTPAVRGVRTREAPDLRRPEAQRTPASGES